MVAEATSASTKRVSERLIYGWGYVVAFPFDDDCFHWTFRLIDLLRPLPKCKAGSFLTPASMILQKDDADA